MCSPAKLSLLAIALLTLLSSVVMGGCYAHSLCGEELCDGFDNDCDGKVDEGFLDSVGRYSSDDHCGACNLACSEVFPTASLTACTVDDSGTPRCALLACAPGFHRAGDGACVPDVDPLCLPCTDTGDCARFADNATCIEIGGESRCTRTCAEDDDCGVGFQCVLPDEDFPRVCLPLGDDCTCRPEMLGATFGCLVRFDDNLSCAGSQACTEMGLSECESQATEICNSADDDCDGEIDEDFVDSAGRYVSRLHCGACNRPCVEPGPNAIATCVAVPNGATCAIECEDGFVNVDGVLANGCECELLDVDAIPIVGGDADCDGEPDDSTQFVFVSPTGSDTNPGTLARPVSTLGRGAQIGAQQNKTVLVSRGHYDGPLNLVEGAQLIGGYSPDFRARNIELYPVVIENLSTDPGPVVRCNNVSAVASLDGVTVIARNGSQPGQGSTAVLLQGCSDAVRLTDVTVLSGRGADGATGDGSSDRLGQWGLTSLLALDGVSGTPGTAGGMQGQACGAVPRGTGGQKQCPRGVVSGGHGGAAGCFSSGCVNGQPCGNAGCTDFTVNGVCNLAAALAVAAPNPAAQSGRGSAGGAAGELTYNAPTNRFVCHFCDDNPTLERIGGNGGDGLPGVDGSGGLGCGMGLSVDLVSGLVRGGDGLDGTTGGDGSGGGGATAGAGFEAIGGSEPGCTSVSGGSGGGGGSGGCGAPGAAGGQGGGASVGIWIQLASNASVGPVLTRVRVVTGSGGDGGNGGVGASGGTPGTGALGGDGRMWCARNGGRGGDGGKGGDGGGGGGGCGGVSVGVLLRGGGPATAYETALRSNVQVDEGGVPGRGGNGGFSPSASGSPGADGVAAPLLRL